ncbi:MAG: hypothetical protein JW827_04845 [Spirochaetes bacterium]|nr:hypothetical protein [Spirochaetota bacterium]
MIKIYVFVIFLFLGFNLKAYNFDNGDARAISLGSSSVFLNNANSAWLNPASLSRLTKKEIDLSYEVLYLGLDSRVYTGESDYFNNLRVSFALPLDDRSIGIGLFQFYSIYFRNTKLRITATEKLGGFRVGINFKYISYDYIKNEYTDINPYLQSSELSAENIGLDAGALAEIIKDNIFASLSLLNINQPDIGIVTEDRLNIRIRGGVGLMVSGFSSSLEIEYSEKEISGIHFGLETFLISRSFPVRLGFNNSFLPAAGFTFKIKDKPEMGIDYAANLFSEIDSNNGSHYFTFFIKF